MYNFLLNHTPLLYLTQSLWRDEAFSVWIAQDSISEVVRRTSGDFNPPLYYLLLHIWMNVFGRSEIALRLFSSVAFIALLFLVYRFAYAVFKRRSTAFLAAALTAINPMLLYFAFELRMYALLTFLATASMYFFYRQKWRWYILATVAGLYTQPFMVFVLLAQGVYALATNQLKTIIRPWLVIGLLFLPWLPTLIRQFTVSGPMWIWPVSWQLIKAVLANLYTGYEGTPGHLWNVMALLSIVFFGISLFVVQQEQWSKRVVLFCSWVFIPLGAVLGISFVKPIYVHRYVIFVTVGEIFVLSTAFHLFKSKLLRAGFTIIVIGFTVLANWYAVPFHRKADFAGSFAEIAQIIREGDIILAQTPLVYYESLYYATDPSRVYLYNPHGIVPPRYVGSVGMPPERWHATTTPYPAKSFIIHEDARYSVVSNL